jgi:hypothetical protein
MTDNLPVTLNYGQDAGRGFEKMDSSELQIPFLLLLQSNSPQLKDREFKGRAGDLVDPISGNIYEADKGLEFVPAARRHTFVEWTPRNQGGSSKFVAQHEPQSELVRRALAARERAGKMKLENGNELVETFYLTGISVPTMSPIVIGFSSTKIKVYRGLATRLSQFYLPDAQGKRIDVPLFAHRLRVCSFLDANSLGEFYNYSIQPFTNGSMRDSLLSPDSDLYKIARDLNAAIVSGGVSIGNQPAAEDETGPLPF